MSMNHAAALKSRSWMLVAWAEDSVESVYIAVDWVLDHKGGMHLEHHLKVHPLMILVDSVPV